MYKAEVIADNNGQWCGNALVFDTKIAAEMYAQDLAMRWTLVSDWRVIEIDDVPTSELLSSRRDGAHTVK